jgi:hypothetical protein
MNLTQSESTALIHDVAKRNARKARYFEDLAAIKADAKLYKAAKLADCGYMTFSQDTVNVDTLIAPIKKHSNQNHRIRGEPYAANIANFLARPKRGTYLFNLHDVNEVEGAIGFGHKHGLNAPILPDFYQMNNYSGKLNNTDAILFKDKMSKVVFAGASTGSEGYNLKQNDRVNYCKYVAERSQDLSMCNFYLTSVVQMSPLDLKRYVKSDELLQKMLHNPIKEEDQLTCKYIMSIDGNAAAWDRPIWIMNSNSLLFQAPRKYEMWYDAFLRDSEHYITVEKDNLANAFNFCESNAPICENIISNAHKFVKDFAAHPHGYEYVHFFLEGLNEYHSP